MKQDRANSILSLSSKNLSRDQRSRDQEIEGLRADLEAEQSRRQRALCRFSGELRHLRQEAETELQRACEELTTRRGHQNATLGPLHSKPPARLVQKAPIQRDVPGGHGKDEQSWTGGSRRGAGRTDHKLERLLLRFYQEVHAEKDVHDPHGREEWELEKALFLCRLLEGRGSPWPGRRSHRAEGSVRDPSQPLKGTGRRHHHCPPQPPQNSPRSSTHSPHSASPPAPHRKPGRPVVPSGWDAFTAHHVSTVVLGDTCCSGAPEPGPPESSPHEGRDHRPSNHSTGSEGEESPPTEWSQRAMDQVRVYAAPYRLFPIIYRFIYLYIIDVV